MKKITIFLFSACSLFAFSCAKEDASGVVTESQSEKVTLSATIDNETTKTDYTISGTTATFKWSGTEVFAKLTRAVDSSVYGYYTGIDYTSTSELDAASGTFSGDDVASGYEDTGLALYPVNKSNGADLAFPTSSTAFTLTLEETITYDASNPLKDIVPMIGYLSSDEYTFKPLTGVLAIPVSNIPASATKITIASTGMGLSGTTGTITGKTDATYQTSLSSQLYESSTGLPLSWFSTEATKTLSFSGLDSDTDYTFYFPIPTGTLPDLTITIYNGTTVLYTATTTNSIEISRGVIKKLPTITFPNYKVTVGGTSAAPTGDFYVGNNITLFFSVFDTATITQSNFKSGMKWTYSGVSGQSQMHASYSLTNAFGTGATTTSGLKYLQYVVASSDYSGKTCGDVTTVLASGAIPFYYLASGDNTILAHQFTMSNTWTAKAIDTTTDGNYHPGSSNESVIPLTFTIAASNDPTEGNIMLTEFLGRGYTYALTISAVQTYWTAGNPLYGTYDGTTITFPYSTDGLWITSSQTYCLGGSTMQNDVKSATDAATTDLTATITSSTSPYAVSFSNAYVHMKYTTDGGTTYNTFACLNDLVGTYTE